MSKKQIVFLGSKAIGAFCLKHLLDNAQLYDIEIIAVSTKQNAALDKGETVHSLAEKNELLQVPSVSEIPLCDIIISVQHHEILKQDAIDREGMLLLTYIWRHYRNIGAVINFLSQLLMGKRNLVQHCIK